MARVRPVAPHADGCIFFRETRRAASRRGAAFRFRMYETHVDVLSRLCSPLLFTISRISHGRFHNYRFEQTSRWLYGKNGSVEVSVDSARYTDLKIILLDQNNYVRRRN